MKELTLKEIQQMSLDILLDVHNYCVAHDIHYSLAYGTLIGAARHQGFIPWDDDVDIVLTRPEYDRLCREYRSEHYRLVTEKDSWVTYARVCDTNQTELVSLLPWTRKRHMGVCIDIFPIDNVSDVQQEFSAQIDEILSLFPTQHFYRSLHRSFSPSMSWKTKVKLVLKRVRYCLHSAKEPNAQIARIAARYPYGSTQHCSQLVCNGNGDREFFPITLFDSYTTLPFEGHQLMVACGWQEMLRLNYGDYMQLPPKEKREDHSHYMWFYWR